jgi:outer membrane receptor protein involved in Fe transport
MTGEEPEQCGRIHRDQFGSLWMSPEAFVDATLQNVSRNDAEGIDLTASYLIGLGASGFLATDLVGTYLLKRTMDAPPLTFDCAGYYGGWCGQTNARWRHRLRLTWEAPFNLDLSLAWRRIGSAESDFGHPDPLVAWPEGLAEQQASGADHLPAYDWFDLAASYTFGSGIRWTLGINNILDEEPPLLAGLADVQGTWLTFYGTYDPLGRYIFTSVQFQF